MTAAVGQMRNMSIVTPVVTLHSRLHESDLEALSNLAHELAKA